MSSTTGLAYHVYMQRLAILSVLTVSCGCAARVDDSKLIRDARQANPKATQLSQSLRDVQVQVTRQDGAKGDPFWRSATITWHAKLARGFDVAVSQSLQIARSGSSTPLSSSCSVRSPNGQTGELTKPEFDALLAAHGDLASLQTFGFVFALKPVDTARMIEALRKVDPCVDRLYQAHPATVRAESHRLHPFKVNAKVEVWVPVGKGYNLWLGRAIRVAADGVTPEVVGEAELTLARLMRRLPSLGSNGK